MEKSTFEQMGGTYRQEGDYILPNLTVSESVPVGVWGQRRRQYLQKHRKALYIKSEIYHFTWEDFLCCTNLTTWVSYLF